MHLVSEISPIQHPAFSQFSDDVIKNEPMLFNCDMAHAMSMGGPITKEFLLRIPLDWHDEPLVIDTRVHMLMPGWIPCIPGWHHDDVPRTRADGQPNYLDGQDRSWHCMALINSHLSPTQFATGASYFPYIQEGAVVYKRWHPFVEQYIASGELKVTTIPDSTVFMFNDRTWHRGTPAIGTGWRWFGRVSRYFDKFGKSIPRRNQRTNEIRRQVQMYMSEENAGW